MHPISLTNQAHGRRAGHKLPQNPSLARMCPYTRLWITNPLLMLKDVPELHAQLETQSRTSTCHHASHMLGSTLYK
jgi:hypothetical protein